MSPKNKPANISKESVNSWLAIQQALLTPLVQKFDWKLPIVLETDASQIYLGAVLLQPHLRLNKNHISSFLYPIAYFSRKLNQTQQRYSVQGRDVTVITDHQSLDSIRTKAEQLARIARFLDTIKHYGINILYRKESANFFADYSKAPNN